MWHEGLAFVLGLVVTSFTITYLSSNKPRDAFEEELKYRSIYGDGIQEIGRLRSVFEDGDDDSESNTGNGWIELSVVVPSYNEVERIADMLKEAIDFLQEEYGSKWEIIIVDDGSNDGTGDFCLKFVKDNYKVQKSQFKVVSLVENRGKGGAVTHGMLHVRGKYGLFVDADGASKFSDVKKLLKAFNGRTNASGRIAIGSRAHMVNTHAVVKRSFLRNFLMHCLHLLVYVFGNRTIKDTQCGFKLFDRQAIRNTFPYLHTEGWIFDVELLILASRKGIYISEVPISWHEVSGSKMVLSTDSITIAKDLIVIRLAYLFGIYNQGPTH